jgi:hypothetical protein
MDFWLADELGVFCVSNRRRAAAFWQLAPRIFGEDGDRSKSKFRLIEKKSFA